ncbi:MAG: HEAT repeat domain-containing protein [Planctomycetota bacterium]|jgi:hypothetical protein
MKVKVLLVMVILAGVVTAKVRITAVDPNGKEHEIEWALRDETDEMVDKIVRTQYETVSELIMAIAEPNVANMRKVKIIYALGELRAYHATSILIKNINLVAERPDIRVGIGRWGQYPAREALVKIGPYASRMIMEIIGSRKFDRAKVDGYAAVIAEIERPRYALMKLDDWIARAEDETVRGRYEVVKARIKQPAVEEEGRGTGQAMQYNVKEEKRKEEWLEPLEGLRSEDVRVRAQAVDSLLQGHQQTVQELISLVDPNNAQKYSEWRRRAAAYVLGEFRAVEAIPVLSRAAALPQEEEDLWYKDRYHSPYWTALMKIGRPAVPALIENIEGSDDETLRMKSSDVLNHILGGKRRLLEPLTKLKVRAEEEQDKKRIERIEAALEYAQRHYKEDKEPLY